MRSNIKLSVTVWWKMYKLEEISEDKNHPQFSVSKNERKSQLTAK
uniref:Bm1403 n=1 Tax=Brugia malayi TaxID=6279 RepID=A0A1I9G386_BRUMA|nr:Bm1403 [Brugia malayi]